MIENSPETNTPEHLTTEWSGNDQDTTAAPVDLKSPSSEWSGNDQLAGAAADIDSSDVDWKGNDQLAGAAAPVESALNPKRMPIEVLSISGEGDNIKLAVTTENNDSSQQTPK